MKKTKVSLIPEISFLKKNNESEIEILRFKSLLQRQDRLNPSPEKPHRINFYIIMYITHGNGIHFIDFQPYKFDEGSIILVSKGQVHAFDFSNVRDGFLILFTDEFLSKNLIHSDILSLHKLYNYHLHKPVMCSEETKGLGFKNIINEISKEYDLSDDFAREELLRLLLKIVLLKMERFKHGLIPEKINSEYILAFTAFKNHLENHFKKTRNAKDYAQMMHISYKHLNEICKRITGNTVKRFIDKFVILEIKRHLATTGFSVKELTYELGFDEPTNFVKFFFKHTQKTPSKFKQSLKK